LALNRTHSWVVYFRPSQVQEGEWELLENLPSGDEDYGYRHDARYCRVLFSEGFSAMAERLESTPVPEGGFEENPALSVAPLVDAVRERFDLSEHAAALYLQTLTLLSPDKKRVLRVNAWSPAQYKKACSELVARDLLMEAKRARAGRAHFLPGGWEALASPAPAFETWKLPLYDLQRVPDTNRVTGPLGALLPLRPVHQLFAMAWQRVVDGDAPQYEEVRS
jgi:hypothetical protein